MAGQPKTQMKKASKEAIELERRSDEFTIKLSIVVGKKPAAVKCGFSLVDAFLNGINYFFISLKVPKNNAKDPIIVKNMGFAFGEAIRRLWDKRRGKTNGISIHSEGEAMCMFAINAKRQPGEANVQLMGAPERGLNPDTLFFFFEGFAEGMQAQVNVTVNLTREKSQIKLISQTLGDSLKQILRI